MLRSPAPSDRRRPATPGDAGGQGGGGGGGASRGGDGEGAAEDRGDGGGAGRDSRGCGPCKTRPGRAPPPDGARHGAHRDAAVDHGQLEGGTRRAAARRPRAGEGVGAVGKAEGAEGEDGAAEEVVCGDGVAVHDAQQHVVLPQRPRRLGHELQRGQLAALSPGVERLEHGLAGRLAQARGPAEDHVGVRGAGGVGGAQAAGLELRDLERP